MIDAAPDRRPMIALRWAALALAAWAGVAALRAPLLPLRAYEPAEALSAAARERVNQSPFALILGEARAGMADLLWVKTERYLHRGVAFRPHLDADELARTGRTDHEPHGDHEDPDAEATFIPVPERDPRGVIGVLHRAIQPWQGPGAPHEHTAGEELLPWYRLLTLSNPHHWRGYMIGAWWLFQQRARAPQAVQQALDFLAEGIRHNPDVFQLRLLMGRLLLGTGHPAEAVEQFRAALALGLRFRPPGGSLDPPRWTISDEEDFAAAARYVPLVLWRSLNQLDEARASVARARALVPNDGPLRDLEARLAAETGTH